ncbi:MAG: hypothetical protein CVU52_02020 [Deltaproteobacteria bacterium HGW-Deltaproteobacteria-10]|nr:MAG: hypothetical protein CVU52_02020 [Deltaproteobacteria bacterium HGW-Deltaproteobacteria-10]
MDNVNGKEETLVFCRENCSKSIKLFIGNLIAEGVPKEKLLRALKNTEVELEKIVTSVHDQCSRSQHKDDENKAHKAKRKDHLTRIIVHYLQENDSMDKAVYFPRQSFKIFAEAIRKLLGDKIIEEKQLESYAVVKEYQDENGHIKWDDVYVDTRSKQLTWDILFRTSIALSGVTGEWFKEYIADYAKVHGGFFGEGMAHYVEQRLESIAKMFPVGR